MKQNKNEKFDKLLYKNNKMDIEVTGYECFSNQ
jgi:hypothetical protein